MAKTIYFVVQPFDRGSKARYLVGDPIEARNAAHAKRLADRLAAKQAGAIAFAREGDPDLGEWDDAIVLGVFGDVPEEALTP